MMTGMADPVPDLTETVTFNCHLSWFVYKVVTS